MPRLFDPQVTRLRGTEYFIHFKASGSRNA